MAIRVHVLRTCDRCGRPIETEGSVPMKQLKEGDVIPAFPRGVIRVVREDPQPDGASPSVRVLGEFTDLCDPCGNVVDRALETLVKRAGADDGVAASTTGDASTAGTPERRRRAGRPPKTVAPDMPGPNGAVVPDAPASIGTGADDAAELAAPAPAPAPASGADVATPDEDESRDPF